MFKCEVLTVVRALACPLSLANNATTHEGEAAGGVGEDSQSWCVFLCFFHRFAYPGEPWVFLNAGGAGYWRHTRPILDRSAERGKEEMGDDVLLISDLQRQEITSSTHVCTKKSARIAPGFRAYRDSGHCPLLWFMFRTFYVISIKMSLFCCHFRLSVLLG